MINELYPLISKQTAPLVIGSYVERIVVDLPIRTSLNVVHTELVII